MKSSSFILILLAVISTVNSQQINPEINPEMSPENIVQANLESYNKGDIEGFMSYFSEDIQIRNYDNGEVSAQGKQAVREIYMRLFEASPKLHSKILKRTVFDNKVIDHEFITGRNGSSEPLELVLIYEVRHGKIFRISVMRK